MGGCYQKYILKCVTLYCTDTEAKDIKPFEVREKPTWFRQKYTLKRVVRHSVTGTKIPPPRS